MTPHEKLVALCILRQRYSQYTQVFVVTCSQCQETRYLRYWGYTYYVRPFQYHFVKCHTCGAMAVVKQEVS